MFTAEDQVGVLVNLYNIVYTHEMEKYFLKNSLKQISLHIKLLY